MNIYEGKLDILGGKTKESNMLIDVTMIKRQRGNGRGLKKSYKYWNKNRLVKSFFLWLGKND
jgi:hypothetical protein